MTRGQKSSERKACYHATIVGLVIALLGINFEIDPVGLSALVVAVTTPLMWYAGNRSVVKIKNGEE